MDCNGMSEVRRSGFNCHVQQSPRIGGCTGAFFNLFDWNNTKRFAAIKRLPAERSEKLLRRSKSFRDERSRGCAESTRDLTYDKADDRGVISDDEASSRPPVGLVARLMGLESLPESTPRSKHRRSHSFSGNESVYYFSERDTRPERQALRDMLEQERSEHFEMAWDDEFHVVPTVEHRNRRRARKGDFERTPTKTSSLVPYVDSPCRTVYALPCKGEKSPYLARLHPSPVLQPSKCHNQMVTPTSPAAVKKRASRFLEAAVQCLEEISDDDERFPSEREGMRCRAEFVDASSPAGTDLLYCRSMTKGRNGSDGAESVGSRSNRSLRSRGSISFRDSQRRDRICRDIFEGSLSERGQSVSPLPRNSSKGRRILRTQEAAVGDFKTDVREVSTGPRKSNFEVNSKLLLHTPAPVRAEVQSLHIQATGSSSGLEDHCDGFTSDEDSPLVSTAVATLGEDRRSRSRKSPKKGVRPVLAGGCRVARSSRERSVDYEVPSSTSGNSHGGLRPILTSRNRQQENGLLASSKRVSSTELSTSRSAARAPNHIRREMDDSKLGGRGKKDASSKQQEKQGRSAAAESPSLQCRSPLTTGAPLKRTRRKARHGSPKLKNSSSPSRSLVKTPRSSNLHDERNADQHSVDAKMSPRNPSQEKDSEVIFSNVSPDIAQPDSLVKVEVIDVNSDSIDEMSPEAGDLLRHETVEHMMQCSTRDSFLSPEMDQCNDEMLILGMEDLLWDDATAEQHPEYNSSRARECSAADGGESSTPVFMKFFLGKPLRLDVDMGETSPVSVLESPFGDEACATSESSIPEADPRPIISQEQTETATGFTEPTVTECEIERVEVSTPPPIDRIRQAILDISSFANRDQDFDSNQGSPQTERTFVRVVLSAAQLLCSPGRSPNWYERDLAVDPTLFEKLEAVDDGFRCQSGGMWRCERKLLFDCVNEAFSQNTRHFKDPQPWLRSVPVLRHRAVRQKVVEEVHEKITGWRELASRAIDTLIDLDMSSKEGKWTEFSEDVSEIGAEIEGLVWQVMMDEVVLDLNCGSLR